MTPLTTYLNAPRNSVVFRKWCNVRSVASPVFHEYTASTFVHSVYILIYVTIVRSWNWASKYFSQKVKLQRRNVTPKRNDVVVVVIYIAVQGDCFVKCIFFISKGTFARPYFISNNDSATERYKDNLVGLVLSVHQSKIKSNSWPAFFLLIRIYSLGIC